MTKINGLLTQKPTSPVPKCGETHRYSLTERVSKTGKPWTKVKAEGEGYGKPYEVLSVEKTDFVDAHGNVSFNIDLAELSGGDVNQQDTHVEAASSVKGRAAQSSPPSQPDKDWPEARPTVRSTSTNGSVRTLDTVATGFYAALGKADELVTQFFSDAQRESWSAYEAADLVLRVAAGLSIETNKTSK